MITLKDFTDYRCTPDLSLRQVLARLNATRHLFQIILDANGRLVGTVTDGDIRRAILHGADLDSPAADCMHKTPVSGRAGDDKGNLLRLARLGPNGFLPIVGPDGVVQAVLVAGPRRNEIKTALVMAGGVGSRLGARTRTTPKPLLEVDGKPILEHVLIGLESAGTSTIHVSVNYLADQVREFIANRANRAKIVIVEEERPLGTAGALGYIDAPMSDSILVINGDLVTNADFAALGDFHQLHGCDATIGVTRHETEIPFGVIRHGADGHLEHIEEKPRISHFVAAGFYYLSPAFRALVRSGVPMDMPELLNMGLSAGLTISLFPVHEYWIDVGRPDDLEAAASPPATARLRQGG
jgi:dTDP-glucose pyrophosphorylase